jgi:uncharacterized protein
VTPEAYGRFLSIVFDEWACRDLGKLHVQLFAEMSLIWSGGDATVCWMAPTCGRVLVLEHDGCVYACDHYVDAEHRIGDMQTSDLGTLVDSPAQRHFGEAKRALLPSQCRSCPWLAVCNEGCPKERFTQTADGEPGLNYLCAGLRRFFAHAERPMRAIMARTAQGARPEWIMAEMRAAEAIRWRGTGRNDPCPCGSGRKAKRCCMELRP